MFSTSRTVKNFGQDENGTVAIIFAATAMMLFMVVGLAIDSGRAYRASTKVSAAIDAAALAAARGMRESSMTDAEVRAMALRFFNENIRGTVKADLDINSFTVTIDRNKNSVQIDIDSEVKTTLGQLTGISKLDVPASTVAMFESKDIELSLSLDMTGSMRGQKTADLKTATRDLIEIMLPDAGTPNKIRIGFAPFAAGVNAGDYADAATDYRSPDGCVYERKGAGKLTDAEPSINNFMSVAGDPGNTRSQYRCPGASKVLALTDDKAELLNNVDQFSASGSTAGHLGTAWAWYLVSPEWSAVLPVASKPANYGDGQTIKAVVLMTDGIYNTYGGKYSGGARNKSESDARALCGNIKGKSVIVYAIGFQLADARAISVLQDCASSVLHFFRAENGDQLRAAFRSIAVDLNNLRLTK